MKGFNVKNSKQSSLFLKAIRVLSLMFVLQGKACLGLNSAEYKLVSIADQKFANQVEAHKDISDWKDERGRYVFYTAAKYGYANKVKTILEKFIQNKEAGFKHINEDFINAFDPRTGATALWEAIRSGQKEVIEIFTEEKYRTYIDINKIQSNGVKKIVDSGENSLWLALKNYDDKIANILLRHPNIDIKTKDPISGNTVLHVAIKNKWPDIAKRLIDLFNRQASPLLFAQNNDGDTPLHFAMQYKLSDIQEDLIKLVPKDKLWIKNNTGDDMLNIAVSKCQPIGIIFLMKQPLERLCQKYKNGETMLHVSARLNFPSVVRLFLDRISTLASKEEAVKQLFERTQTGKTVWEAIYLSQFGTEPINDKVNIQMFKDTIAFVKDRLQQADWNAILEGVHNRESRSRLQGGISKEYADRLRQIVNDARPASKP